MKRAIALALVLSALAIACQHLEQPGPTHDLLARTARFTITADDLARWAPLLRRERNVRRASREQGGADAAIVRQVALIRIVVADGAHLLPAGRRAVLSRDLADREVRRVYDREVLEPRAGVTLDDARRIFEQHRDGFRKAPGVRCLELFRWAPADQAALRTDARRLLERVRAQATDREAFKRAVWQHSDATSAVWSGNIGTVLSDQVGEPLRSALLGTETGPTEIIEADEGLFLFWVLDHTPARDNRFEDVADGILERLTRQRLEQLGEQAAHEILASLELLDPLPTDRNASAVRYRGRLLSLSDLDLDTPSPDRIRDRIVAVGMREQLEAEGFEIPDPAPEQLQWRLFRQIWPLMVDARLAAGLRDESPDDRVEPPDDGPAIESWTFTLLILDGSTTQRELLQTFRSLHELGPGAGIEALAGHLRSTWGLEPTVRHYDHLPAPAAAALGPEIHTTLKRRLSPGELSRPMHLADRHQVVVLQLISREADPAATAEAAQRADARRTRRQVERLLESEMLDASQLELFTDRS